MEGKTRRKEGQTKITKPEKKKKATGRSLFCCRETPRSAENRQGIRYDAAVQNFSVKNFAVHFGFAVVQNFDHGAVGAVDLGAGRVDVLAAVEKLDQQGKNLAFFDFVDDDDIEFPVKGIGIGGDGHASADAGAVGGSDQKNRFFLRDAVDGQAQFVKFGVEQDVDQRGVVAELPFEKFDGFVTDERVDVHACAGAIQGAAVAQLDKVDISLVPAQNDVEGALHVGRNCRRTDKIVTRSARNETQNDVLEIFDSVENFAERPVASHDDQIDGLRRQRGGELFGVSLILCFVHGVRDRFRVQNPFDDVEGGAAFAFCRNRVEDDVVHNSSRNCRIAN